MNEQLDLKRLKLSASIQVGRMANDKFAFKLHWSYDHDHGMQKSKPLFASAQHALDAAIISLSQNTRDYPPTQQQALTLWIKQLQHANKSGFIPTSEN